MVHLWSDFHVPERSATLAPIIDEVIEELDGRIDAVRKPFSMRAPCPSTIHHAKHLTF